MKFWKEQIEQEGVKERVPLYILFTLTLMYALIFSVLSIDIHNRFGTSGFDLGIFDQANWLISHWKTPFVTVRGLHIFADHASYIHLLTAPVFWIWEDVRALLILQTLAFTSGAVAIYLIARTRFKDSWAPLAFVFSYLMYPSLQHINLWQYHPESLGVPFLLFAFYFATRSRYKLYFLFVFLTLITKEEFSITVFALGIYVGLNHDLRRGILTSVLSLTWLALVFKILIPHFNEFGYFRLVHGQMVFGRFGTSIGEIIKNLFLHPVKLFASLFTDLNKRYIFGLLAPVGFLPLLSPSTFFIALPALIANMLSGFYYMHLINHHYAAIIIAPLYISTIYAVARIKNPSFQKAALILLVLSTILGNIYLGPYDSSPTKPGNLVKKFKDFGEVGSDYERNVLDAMRLIPKNASVSASPFFVPHLTHREVIYEFPNPFETSNWGVRDENPPPKDVDYVLTNTNTVKEEERLIFSSLVETGLFNKIYDEAGILLLKSDYNGSLDPSYYALNLRLDSKFLELAQEKQNYMICDKVEDTSTREVCYMKVGILTEDYNLCAVKIKAQLLRDTCFKEISISTRDLNLCRSRIVSERLRRECTAEITDRG